MNTPDSLSTPAFDGNQPETEAKTRAAAFAGQVMRLAVLEADSAAWLN